MANEYGIKSDEYRPEITVAGSGLIAKIARQIVEHEEVPELYDEFNKEAIENGKEVEITIYETATGKAYDPKGENPTQVPDPVGHTLILTSYLEKSYSTFINNWDIAKAARDGSYAADTAAAIIQTLYEGYSEDINEAVENILNNATAAAPNSDGTTQIVTVGDVPEVSDENTARQVLLAIKTAATGMKTDPATFNPYAFKKAARRVVLVIPYETRIKIDTYLYANTRQVDYIAYDVDRVIEVPASATSGAIYVLDTRYIQRRKRRQTYDEKPLFNSGGNVAAGLAVSELIAGCPFFCAVKLPQGAAAAISLSEFSLQLDKNIAANATAARKVSTVKTATKTKVK